MSLALAELYFHAAAEQSFKQDSTKKTKSSAQQSQQEQMLQGCTANVGMFESALFQQQLSLYAPASQSSELAHTEAAGAAAQPAQSASHLLVRYHWLGACVSQHLKRFEDAAQQYEACKAGLTILTQTPEHARYTQPVLAGAPAISTELVDTRLDALKLIVVVEDGCKCLDEGRRLELISRLAPVLLASNTSKVPLDVVQQLVGLNLLQVRYSLTSCDRHVYVARHFTSVVLWEVCAWLSAANSPSWLLILSTVCVYLCCKTSQAVQ